MAARTSASAGNWSATGTWSGGVVPGNGDTVTINHNVAVDVDTTVGHSPQAGDATAAIRLSYPANLTVNAGVTLVIRGDLTGAGSNIVIVRPGATMEFDMSAAATPSTAAYVYNIGPLGSFYVGNYSPVSSGATATVRSNAAGAQARITTGASGDAFAFTDAVFSRLGSESAAALNLSASANSWTIMKFNRVTFDQYCGQLTVGGVHSGGTFEMNDCRFEQTTGSINVGGGYGRYCSAMITPGGAASGTRPVNGCYFNRAAIFVAPSTMAITRCMFMNSPVCVSGGSRWHSFENNFVTHLGQETVGILGNTKDCYVIACLPWVDNPHWWGLAEASHTAETTFDGVVFDPFSITQASDSGEVFMLGNPATAQVLNIKRCLMLPGENTVSGKTDKACAGAMVWIGSASPNLSLKLNHNTAFMSRPSSNTFVTSMCSMGENHTPAAGVVDEFRSNLAWSSDVAGAKLCLDNGKNGSVANTVSEGAALYNGGYNLATVAPLAAGYDYISTGTAPGTGDVIGNPQFVAPYRNIKTWAQSLGLSGSTAVELKDAAIAYLGADMTRLDALLAHVRAGSAPTNTAFQSDYETNVSGTSPTNGWIGAVEGTEVTPTVTATRSRIVLTGGVGASTRSTATLSGGA
jgi:hypothetical protein